MIHVLLYIAVAVLEPIRLYAGVSSNLREKVGRGGMGRRRREGRKEDKKRRKEGRKREEDKVEGILSAVPAALTLLFLPRYLLSLAFFC